VISGGKLNHLKNLSLLGSKEYRMKEEEDIPIPGLFERKETELSFTFTGPSEL